MSPRSFSSQSSWGPSGDRVYTFRALIVVGVTVLMVGLVAGWVFRGGSKGPAQALNTTSNGIDPSIDSILTAPKTDDGVVRAGTALISGFPSLSLKSTNDRSSSLQKLIAPSASSDLLPKIRTQLETVRASLVGPATAETAPTARIVITPLTYKLNMVAADKAELSIWYVTVLIDPDGAKAQSTWGTSTLSFVWTDHWRMVTYNDIGGPTPPLYAPNAKESTYDDVAKVFSSFKAYRSALANN